MSKLSVNKSRKPTTQDCFTKDLEPWLKSLLQLWRQKNKSSGPANRLSESEIRHLAKPLQILSQGLTRDRQLAGEHYFSDQDMLGTYLLYFWPISYVQARYVLHSLSQKPCQVLELGAGAGPLGAACYDLNIKKVSLADRSQVALEHAKQLFRKHGQQPDFYTWDPYQENSRLSGKYDLIALQHVVNEFWTNSADRLLKIETLLHRLREHLTTTGSLLLIEPALTPTSRSLLQLRDQLILLGWHVSAPCLHQDPCPALNKETDSCHLDIPWQLPEMLKPLVKIAGFKKKELKISYCLLQPNKPLAAKEELQTDFLIVSERMLSKNKRVRYIGCGRAGRIGLALKPEQATEQQKIFLSLKRGDIIRINNALPTEQGIRISPETQIRLLSRALYENRERGFGGEAPESDRGGQQNASAFASGGPSVPPKAPLPTKE
jgi:ribosomal protein RSM22 (predicted rRNA methylase)